jgi:hypothetical protein
VIEAGRVAEADRVGGREQPEERVSGRITRFWSRRVSLPSGLQDALDHEHHVRAAGVIFVEHERTGC